MFCQAGITIIHHLDWQLDCDLNLIIYLRNFIIVYNTEVHITNKVIKYFRFHQFIQMTTLALQIIVDLNNTNRTL